MLDPASLLLAILVTHVASAVVLSVAWFSLRREAALADWAISRVVSSIALLFLLLRGFIDPAWSILIGNSLVFASFYLILRGFQRFAGQPEWPRAYVVTVYIVYAGCIAYAAIPSQQHDLLVMLSSALFVLFYGLLVVMLWPRNRGYDSLIANLLVGVYVVNVVAYGFRLAVGALGLSGEGLLDATSQDTVVFLVTIGTALMVTMGVLAMTAERINQRLVHKADRDHLTGLYNRVRLDAEVKKKVEAAQGNAAAFGVILADLDHFKSVNDTHGHQAGDSVLIKAAQTFLQNCRAADCVGRLGGEEFLIIADGKSTDELVELAETLRAAIERCDMPEIKRPLTASFGVAAYEDGESVRSLLSRADKALYRAKELGRNLVCVGHGVGVDPGGGEPPARDLVL